MSDTPPCNLIGPRKLAPVWRALVEVGSIGLPYYTNTQVGELKRSRTGKARRLWRAGQDIFTESNFTIAIASALVGHLAFEFLRKRF